MQNFAASAAFRDLLEHIGWHVALLKTWGKVAQVGDWHAEDFGDLARVALELSFRLEQCDDGCGGEACRCPNIVEQSDDAGCIRLEADFFVGFAQRTGLHGFARLEFAAGKRNLAFVGWQFARAYRQDQFRVGFERDGDKHGGMPKAWNLERESFTGTELVNKVLKVQLFP